MHTKIGVRRRFFGLAMAIPAGATILAVGAAVPVDAGIARGSFRQTNLVSDIAGLAQATDPKLVNPWGLSSSATSPIWVSDNGAGVSTLYRGNGAIAPLVVTIPAPSSPIGGTPTGTVFNTSTTTSDFNVKKGSGTAKAAVFLFATEDGTILGWSPLVDLHNAVIAVDNSAVPDSANGAVYKGLTLGMFGGHNYLYAANFRSGAVDVFNGSFDQVTFGAGSFTDPALPSGYAPFGIENIGGGQIFVTFAKQDAARHDDVKGPGKGFVDIFGTDGTLVRRFATQGTLNAPWGLALAPSTFGNFHGDVLVGNFGDGLINAYTPAGVFRGQLKSETNAPIQIDGLWGLRFGNGGGGGDPSTLFFAAGIMAEAHGLFGTIQNVD